MKRSGDLVIGRSGDRKNKLTAETRRRGESRDRGIGKSGHRKYGEEASEHLTTEKQGHGKSHWDSVFSDHPITCDHQITRSPSVPAVFRRIIRTFRATLREIFDESAYDRFLLRTQASRSTASYREFTRERDAAMAKKPRCC